MSILDRDITLQPEPIELLRYLLISGDMDTFSEKMAEQYVHCVAEPPLAWPRDCIVVGRNKNSDIVRVYINNPSGFSGAIFHIDIMKTQFNIEFTSFSYEAPLSYKRARRNEKNYKFYLLNNFRDDVYPDLIRIFQRCVSDPDMNFGSAKYKDIREFIWNGK